MNWQLVPNRPGVYWIICLATDDTYIGNSELMGNRVHGHAAQLRRGTHPADRMQELYDQHGPDHFQAAALVEVEGRTLLPNVERCLIHLLAPSMNGLRYPYFAREKVEAFVGCPIPDLEMPTPAQAQRARRAKGRTRFGVNIPKRDYADLRKIAKGVEGRSLASFYNLLIERINEGWKTNPQALLDIGLIRPA